MKPDPGRRGTDPLKLLGERRPNSSKQDMDPLKSRRVKVTVERTGVLHFTFLPEPGKREKG